MYFKNTVWNDFYLSGAQFRRACGLRLISHLQHEVNGHAEAIGRLTGGQPFRLESFGLVNILDSVSI